MDEIGRNVEAVDRLVAAYNARDAAQFASCFAIDGAHGDLNALDPLIGRDAIREHYAEIFNQYPASTTEIVHRIAFGAYVVDHERVRRSPRSAPLDVIAIYRIKGRVIARADFVRS
jgi:hypothetical protein